MKALYETNPLLLRLVRNRHVRISGVLLQSLRRNFKVDGPESIASPRFRYRATDGNYEGEEMRGMGIFTAMSIAANWGFPHRRMTRPHVSACPEVDAKIAEAAKLDGQARAKKSEEKAERKKRNRELQRTKAQPK